MEQQQKKRDGPVRCVCEERRASEQKSNLGLTLKNIVTLQFRLLVTQDHWKLHNMTDGLRVY